MRLNAYCGNLLWQSNLTLQALQAPSAASPASSVSLRGFETETFPHPSNASVSFASLNDNFARPCWLVSGNFHAGQKACANCVEAGGRLSHESTFAGPT